MAREREDPEVEAAADAAVLASRGAPVGDATVARLLGTNREAMARLTDELHRALWALWLQRDASGKLPGGLAFEDVAAKLVLDYRGQMARLAALLVSSVRLRETGRELPATSLFLAGAPPLGFLVRSLRFAGEFTFARVLSEGRSRADAERVVRETLLGTASRFALNGSRDTIVKTSRRDARSYGWLRVTDGDPCHFCAMLASRGPVYSSENRARWADGIPGNPYHNACSCIAVPRYTDQTTPQADAYRLLWDKATEGLSNEAARNAFRKAFERALQRV